MPSILDPTKPIDTSQALEIPMPARLRQRKKYDAIIVGTGQAGPSLAVRLVESGMEVAVIERKFFGGTCVNAGCIPTKAMVASARCAHLARRGADYGVMIVGSVSVDMRKVKARKDAIVRGFQQGVRQRLEQTRHCTVYEGHARLEGPDAVKVDDVLLEAHKIFLNVGARAFVPPIAGLDGSGYLTNARMMNVDFLPEHLLILGGGYVALEFAQMFRRFGSTVTIVEKDSRLMSRHDADLSEAVREILEAEGIAIHLQTECTGVIKQKDAAILKLKSNGGEGKVTGSHLLIAVGRRPNTDDLGLDAAGIESDQSGYIVVDDQLRTNVPGIWALGDCNGRGAFTHTSYNDYEIVAANLLDNDPRRVSDRIPAHALYIDPPLGFAGMTEADVRRSGRKALIGRMPMIRVSRAVEKGETQGFMKILVDAGNHQILGAAVLGVGGDEVIHSILDVMYAKAPYTAIQRAMHIHPTVSEMIPTLLGDLKPLETVRDQAA